ncbi:hypothetical protein BLA29_008092 [Euroglyphus maynei]|uniref:Snurportin-1 n=1 Tax=Euroglyphus maynei TaxID=6958 RepID=A0A1Y3AV74_EURMA|nr:hypothetical protein BLA29_008092 [Euroglyphus maynei]
MRNLIEDTMNLDESESFDQEMSIETNTHIDMEMECSPITITNDKRNNNRRKRLRQNFRKSISDRFMLSEWLVDVPEDFFDAWFFVCCPKGRRTLLIANGGHTRAYTRHGHFLFKFQSRIPGGSNGHASHSEPHRSTAKNSMLDCIWVESERRFYILDVFIWNGCSFYGCDTEFRFFWIHNHIGGHQEEMVTNDSRSDTRIPVQTLPYWPCTMTNIGQYAQHGPYPFETEIDGILFYHKQAPYMAGTTPLVCWLNVSMLADIFPNLKA